MACDVKYVSRLCLLVTALLHTTSCLAPPELFPFGNESGDSFNRDKFGIDYCYTIGILNNESFKYYGSTYTKFYIMTNGALTFGGKAPRYYPTTYNLPVHKPRGGVNYGAIIAPFWNRIDLGIGGRLWYRQSTDPVLLRKASTEIGGPFTAAWIFVATWDSVPFASANFYTGRLLRNTFQVILAADKTREKSYVIFNYYKLVWSASGSNGGNSHTGRGGTSPAIMGFDSGDGTNFVELPGSFTDDNIRVAAESNVGVPGRWIFDVANKPVPASMIEPKSGKQYKVLTERDSKDVGHTASQEACREIGGFLPQPENKAENDFIGNLATFATRLGITDIKHERYWIWDRNNSKVEWSNWWVKYPNGGRQANCAVMAGKALAAKYNLDHSGWIDKSCVEMKHMVQTKICEMDSHQLVASLLHTASSLIPPELFPFGKENGDWKITDDRRLDYSLNLRFLRNESFKYFGSTYNNLFVIANGALSFGGNAYSATPTLYNLPKAKDRAGGPGAVIAPFWNRVDRTGGRVWYRQSTDPDLLKKASTEIGGPFTAAWILVATWDSVPFYGAVRKGRLLRNTFQVILAADKTREKSYVIFNYYKLAWSASTMHKADDTTGRGGYQAAIVGFDAGDGTNYVELPGSFTDDNIRVAAESNVGVPGKWIFDVANKPVPVSRTEPKSGKQYKVLTEGYGKDIGHTASQKACRENGGFLPQPENKAENDFIGNLAVYSTRLGMTDIKHETYWRWDRDNSKVEWSNWLVTYPNGGQQANCGFLVGKALGEKYNLDKSGWIDRSCEEMPDMILATICEIGPPQEPPLGPPPDSDEWMPDRKTGKQYKVLVKKDGKDIGHAASQQACGDIGGFLPEPRNKDENDFIGDLATSATRLGMTDSEREHDWRWDGDNAKVEWSNWWATYPNGGRRENCGLMAGEILAAKYKLDNSGWIDKSCGKVGILIYNIVCERGIKFASAGAGGNIQPPAILMSVVLGLCQLIHRI